MKVRVYKNDNRWPLYGIVWREDQKRIAAAMLEDEGTEIDMSESEVGRHERGANDYYWMQRLIVKRVDAVRREEQEKSDGRQCSESGGVNEELV